MSLLISASFNQTTIVIFITCIGLNDAKKALINGKNTQYPWRNKSYRRSKF